MTALMIIAGLALLFWGGEALVSGAVDLAKRFKISPLVIGLVLVGFGTSTPELMTSILAAMEGQPGIAVGNVVGSNIANIFLILGAAALVYPLACDRKAFKRDGTFMALATLACLGVVLSGQMSMVTGVIFVTLLGSYIFFSIWMERRVSAPLDVESTDVSLMPIEAKGIIKDSAYFIFGLILTFIGAKLLVDGAIDIAQSLGVSETIIGLTVVAVGTSLPELVASCMAAFKKQADIAYGNIIGSNIYNILGILGLTAILQPLDVPAQIMSLDIWVMLGATALLLIFSAWGWQISRVKGGVFLALYIAYTAWLIHIA